MHLNSQILARLIGWTLAIASVVLGLVACGGGSASGASQTVTPETQQMTTAIAIGVPEAATKSITRVMSSQGTAAPGSVIVAPGSVGSEAFVVAVDSNDEPILLGLFLDSANLSIDSTAQTLVRIALNAVEPPTGFTAASINAAVTASANYASLLAAIQAQLAVGKSPSSSSAVMDGVWQVAADVATNIGLLTTSASTLRRPLTASNSTALPYYFWRNGPTDKTWLVDLESTPNFQFLNRSFLAWEVSTDKGFNTIAMPLSTGQPLQIFGYYGGSESTTEIVGAAATERLTITVQQSVDTRRQNSLNMTNALIFDGLTLALKGLGVSPSDTAKCAANFSKTILASSEYTAFVAKPTKENLAAYGAIIRNSLTVNTLVGCQFGFKASDMITGILKIAIKSEWIILTNLVESFSPAQALMKLTSIAVQLIDSNSKSFQFTACKTNGAYSPCIFIKVSDSGEDLPDDALAWTCVRHNVTGLLWEARVSRQTPAHPCGDGPQSTSQCTGFTNFGDGRSFDASTVPAAVGTMCGKSGWRLPTIDEGIALVSDFAPPPDSNSSSPSWITWFAADIDWGWTTSPSPGDPTLARMISFSQGDVGSLPRSDAFGNVRLVR